MLILFLEYPEPQGDRKKNKDSKKKPENIQFPPFYQLTRKNEDCEEGVVLEEGETNSTITTVVPSTTEKPVTTSSQSTPPLPSSSSSSTTTTRKPSITIIQGTNTATVQSNSNDEDEEQSVAEAKPVGKLMNQLAINQVILIFKYLLRCRNFGSWWSCKF